MTNCWSLHVDKTEIQTLQGPFLGLLWVLSLRTLPGSCSEDKRKICSCFQQGEGKGIYFKYTQSILSFLTRLPSGETIYQSLGEEKEPTPNSSRPNLRTTDLSIPLHPPTTSGLLHNNRGLQLKELEALDPCKEGSLGHQKATELTKTKAPEEILASDKISYNKQWTQPNF